MHAYPMKVVGSASLETTSANTNLTAFGAQVAKMVMFTAPTGNTSDMLIVAASGTTGITVPKGGNSGWIPCNNLTDFQYKAGTGGDKVGYFAVY